MTFDRQGQCVIQCGIASPSESNSAAASITAARGIRRPADDPCSGMTTAASDGWTCRGCGLKLGFCDPKNSARTVDAALAAAFPPGAGDETPIGLSEKDYPR